MARAKKDQETVAETQSDPKQRPAASVRDGNLRIVLWRNESEKGPWFNCELSRTFQNENGYQETNKVPASDLLRVAFLAQQAYGEYLELRAKEKADQAANPHEPT